MDEIKQERKEAYKEAVKRFNVHHTVLVKIHGVSKNVIEKWLYAEKRYPPFEAILELSHLLKRLNFDPVKSLEKLVKRPTHRVNGYLGSLDISPVEGGDLSTERRTRARYYEYAGEMIDFEDIRSKLSLSISRQTIIKRLTAAGIEEGQSIANVDFVDYGSRGPRTVQYIYNGIKGSIDDIADMSQVKFQTVRALCFNANSGDDVTELINDHLEKVAELPRPTKVSRGSEYQRIYGWIRKLRSDEVYLRPQEIMQKAKSEGFESGQYKVNIDDTSPVTIERVTLSRK